MTKLSKEDIALFRKAVEEIEDTSPPPPKLKECEARATSLMGFHEHLEQQFQPNDTLFWQKNELPRSTLQKFKRGQLHCEAELDLHGFYVEQAYAMLDHFIRESQTQQRQVVRVIHGKGYNSKEGFAKLKSFVATWLKDLSCVLAYCSAPNPQGGAGAVNILLKKRGHHDGS